MSGSSYGHKGKVPTTISNAWGKHANLPTESVTMMYNKCDYLSQYVGDSIVDADRTQNMGVKQMRSQNMVDKY